MNIFNQSVESAGVAFVKGAKKGIDNLKKKKKKKVWPNKPKDEQDQGRTDFGIKTVYKALDKGYVYHCANGIL